MSRVLFTAFSLGIVVGTITGGQLAARKDDSLLKIKPAALQRQLGLEEDTIRRLYRQNLKLRSDNAVCYAKLSQDPLSVAAPRGDDRHI